MVPEVCLLTVTVVEDLQFEAERRFLVAGFESLPEPEGDRHRHCSTTPGLGLIDLVCRILLQVKM